MVPVLFILKSFFFFLHLGGGSLEYKNTLYSLEFGNIDGTLPLRIFLTLNILPFRRRYFGDFPKVQW